MAGDSNKINILLLSTIKKMRAVLGFVKDINIFLAYIKTFQKL